MLGPCVYSGIPAMAYSWKTVFTLPQCGDQSLTKSRKYSDHAAVSLLWWDNQFVIVVIFHSYEYFKLPYGLGVKQVNCNRTLGENEGVTWIEHLFGGLNPPEKY